MKKISVIIAALIFTVGLALTPQPRAGAQREGRPSADEQKLLEAAASRHGADAGRLRVLQSTTVELPLTGRRVRLAKLLDPDDGRVLTAALDEQGREVEFPALKAEEARTRRARFGKLDPKLHRKIEGLRAGERVQVAFWLNADHDLDAEELRDGRTDLSGDEVEGLLARRAEQVKAASARATEGLARALQRAGHAVERSGEGAPAVFAALPAGLVRQFSERADVQLAYLAEGEQFADHMDVAGPSIRADQLWALGVTGVGSRIAIVEDSRVDFGNSCLPNNLGTRVPDHSNVDDHATAVAGMAAGASTEFSGVAPGAGIYSANSTVYSNFSKIAAALDAGAWNADILNNSWGIDGCQGDGSVNIFGRHADYIVRYIWDTVTASAGNDGECGSKGYVNSVGSGYNVIAVGNYDDSGTADASDNTMNPRSSFLDPLSPHGDREKPEVAAPGTSITSTIMTETGSCDTADVESGSSYSAPMVAGLAAGLMQAQPSLRYYPESVKALIMAGARDNVEGAARLSERDGAGGVNALASYQSTVNNRYTWRSVTPSSFDASGYITIGLGWVNAGQRVKVALVWDSNPTSDYATDPLQADLDLNVVGPGVSQWSASWDNSYEVVDFTPTASGYFQIKVKNYRFQGTREYVAVAWSL